jgi:hypothetical protein
LSVLLHIDDVVDVGPDASVTIEVAPGTLAVLRGQGAG